MAGTNTPNLNLYKPNRTDNVSVIADLNDNMDKIDTFAGNVATAESNSKGTVAIVEDGNTCTHVGGIASGQYVVWKGLLYKATQAISVGTTLSTSTNLSAVTDGIANELNSNLRRYTKADGTSIYYADASLNSIDYNGRLYCTMTCTNLPVASTPGYLDSYIYQKSPLYAKQVFTPYNTKDTYIRMCNNGTWTAWDKFASNSQTENKAVSFTIYELSSRDCNNLTESGHYGIMNGTNTPTGQNYGTLIATRYDANGLYVNQIFQVATSNLIYTRNKNDGTWGSWKQLAFET